MEGYWYFLYQWKEKTHHYPLVPKSEKPEASRDGVVTSVDVLQTVTPVDEGYLKWIQLH